MKKLLILFALFLGLETANAQTYGYLEYHYSNIDKNIEPTVFFSNVIVYQETATCSWEKFLESSKSDFKKYLISARLIYRDDNGYCYFVKGDNDIGPFKNSHEANQGIKKKAIFFKDEKIVKTNFNYSCNNIR